MTAAAPLAMLDCFWQQLISETQAAAAVLMMALMLNKHIPFPKNEQKKLP
jgi:hypothetical protein